METSSRAISRERAKAFYDRLGSGQDWQAFYENPAIDELVSRGRFEAAHAVGEFGCGTGRLAEQLLADHLPPDANYLAMDLSTTMVRLAATRLQPWANRASAVQTDGSPAIPARDGSLDRVVAAYVLDLLSEADIERFLADAARVLRHGGLFCNVGLTFGQGAFSKSICAIWQTIHAWRPVLLGGCRPIEVVKMLDDTHWKVEYRTIKCSYGVCSEIVIAERVAADPH